MADGNERKKRRSQIEQAVEQAEQEQGPPAPMPQKKPGTVRGLTNPMPIPGEYAAGVARGLKRRELRQGDDPRLSGNAPQGATKLGPGVYVGDVNFDQWLERTEHHLKPAEIAKAANWYKEAYPIYEKYFGPEMAAHHMAAWLIANRHITPSGAQLSSLRTAEQTATGAREFGPYKKGSLTDKELMEYWKAVRDGDVSTISRLGGQKIYDFVDSGMGKDTRTFYGDDPRMGPPAVADIHTLRDTGHIDEPLLNWVNKNYGGRRAASLKNSSFGGTPSEAQYEWSADKIRSFADEMNQRKYMGRSDWTPAEVQAIGWMAMSKMLGRQGETAEQAILAHQRHISAELDFGKGAPLHQEFPEWASMTPEQKMKATAEVMPHFSDFAQRMSGAQGIIEHHTGFGSEGPDSLNPAMKARLIASHETAKDYADILGYLAQQREVHGYRWEENGKKLGLAVHGESLQDPDNLARFWEAFKQAHPDLTAGFSPSVHPVTGHHGMEMIFDKGGDKLYDHIENHVVPNMNRIAGEHGLGDLHAEAFRASLGSTGHDWEADPTGESYLARIGTRLGPQVRGQVEDFARQARGPIIRAAIDNATGGQQQAGLQAAPAEEQQPPGAPEEGALGARAPPGQEPELPSELTAPQPGAVPFEPRERPKQPKPKKKKPAVRLGLMTSAAGPEEEEKV